MASQGVTTTASSSSSSSGNSRLSQMQMRFQRKQQQEREQRRIEMTTTTATATATATSTSTTSTASTRADDVNDAMGHHNSIGNGKVRQMFDERRRGVGIDRSHPLKPIASTNNAAVRTTKSTMVLGATAARSTPAGMRKPVTTSRRTTPTNATTTIRSTASRSSNQSHNGHHYDQHDNGNFGKQFSSMSLNEHELIGDRNNNNRSNGTSRETSSNGIKLNPVVTKKSPVVAPSRPTRQATPMVHNAARPTLGARNSPTTPPRQSGGTGTVKSPPKSTANKMSLSNVRRQPQQAPEAGMATCHYCGRHFNEERLAKHEHVCQKMINSKRKVFDASKFRVKGTDAENFQARRPGGGGTRTSRSHFTSTASLPTNPGAPAGGKKNNWRQKHEEFIAAIRAAKQVQAHIARGGKLSDLPPPPPSENPDYIQCPHCLRRFNEAAAERHIPKCANMLHNKPKPGQQVRRR